MGSELFALSFAVQLALGAGYLAYLIAYAGIRQHHTTADAIFKSFAFGVPASAMMTYGYQTPVLTSLIAFALTISAGVCWRWFGMNAWAALARNAKISWADDIPSAWISITAQATGAAPSQVIVEMIDGRVLMCDDTRDFENAYQGPVTLGLIGDIALYVTSEERPDGKWFDKTDVIHAEGDLLTYVPVAQIKRVELRYLSGKVSRAGATAAEVAGEEEPAV
ncbi:hypothetical protein [Sphingomonas sp. BK069]|uniref:hypothetical protein n=1 Tax=Sphingomonas sp. BK069 TaxID=2586979 RepID=UPI0016104205|nr:hypothetical protein [Sphingomonas sp. BK069]MBB3345968.1 hypothetical protein [Sphingomonas sp. BK069]